MVSSVIWFLYHILKMSLTSLFVWSIVPLYIFYYPIQLACNCGAYYDIKIVLDDINNKVGRANYLYPFYQKIVPPLKNIR